MTAEPDGPRCLAIVAGADDAGRQLPLALEAHGVSAEVVNVGAADARAALDGVYADLGRLDGVILTHAAALQPPRALLDGDPDAWADAVQTRLWDVVRWTSAACGALTRGGSVVVLTSLPGAAGIAEHVADGAVGEGARAFVRSAARRWASEAIRVNALLLPSALVADDPLFVWPAPLELRCSWDDVAAAASLLTGPTTASWSGLVLPLGGEWL